MWRFREPALHSAPLPRATAQSASHELITMTAIRGKGIWQNRCSTYADENSEENGGFMDNAMMTNTVGAAINVASAAKDTSQLGPLGMVSPLAGDGSRPRNAARDGNQSERPVIADGSAMT
jgi:hypothetical protein